jgi:hypothetical protein
MSYVKELRLYYLELLVDDSIRMDFVDIVRDVNTGNWGNPLMGPRFKHCALCRALNIFMYRSNRCRNDPHI